MYVHKPFSGLGPAVEYEDAFQRASEMFPQGTVGGISEAECFHELHSLFAYEALVAQYSQNIAEDIRGVFQPNEDNFYLAAPARRDKTDSEFMCDELDSFACSLYENAQTFWQIDKNGHNATPIGGELSEILMSYALYYQKYSREYQNATRVGYPKDGLDDERISFRSLAAPHLDDKGRFYIDMGLRFSFRINDNPDIVRRIIEIAQQTNADIIGLHMAHRYAIEHNDVVLWHCEEEVEDGCYLEAPEISENWISLEQWLQEVE